MFFHVLKSATLSSTALFHKLRCQRARSSLIYLNNVLSLQASGLKPFKPEGLKHYSTPSINLQKKHEKIGATGESLTTVFTSSQAFQLNTSFVSEIDMR